MSAMSLNAQAIFYLTTPRPFFYIHEEGILCECKLKTTQKAPFIYVA